jgi:cellulose synthase/poly-beta-1,6-N-acetylglucosamine synthase-like glycosyltransferase
MTRDYLSRLAEEDKTIILIQNKENHGFIKATNQGLEASSAPYACLMNNDTAASNGWLTRMISIAESDPYIGLVNPRSDSPGRMSIEDYAKKLSGNKGQYIETNQCMGYCMLIKREVIDKIGYLDEAYGIGGFDDTDFSKRAHLAGYKSVCAKDAYVYHDWHTSFKAAGGGLLEKLVEKNEPLFFDKWQKYLRIGYPIVDTGDREDLYKDLHTSLGLAREWNWVHAWLNTGRGLKDDPVLLELPEHQNLRLFYMSGRKFIFYVGTLFRLIERRLKGKKLFDAVLVSDKSLYRVLTFFKRAILVPVFFIDKESERRNDREEREEDLWRERARSIVETIKEDMSR